MKNKIVFTIFFLCTVAGYVFAQTPGFNYQAVLRNDAGEPMTNADVTLNFSLIDGPTNNVIYKENQVLTTDELGILTCMIGSGTVESGIFEEITGVADLSIKIEAELPGETGMTEIGNSKVGIIPFALYGRDEDSDPGNEMQSLSLEGDSLKISKMGGVSIESIKSPLQKIEGGFSLDLSSTQRSNGPTEKIDFKNDGGVSISGGESNTCISPGGSETITSDGSAVKRVISSNAENNNGSVNDARIRAESFFQRSFPGGGLSEYIEWLNRDVEQPALQQEIKVVKPGDEPFIINMDVMLSSNNEGLKGTVLSSNQFLEHMGCASTDVARKIAAPEIKRTNGIDLETKDVWTDLFHEGIFGAGFAIMPFESAPGTAAFDGTNSPANENGLSTFGGTFSTANDNGLTTLSGALPGLDPINGYDIIFNGQNLGVSSTINAELAGTSSTYGANGQLNTTNGTFAGDADGGAVTTYDQSGNLGAYVWTKNDGTSQVGADQFVMTASPPGRSDHVATFSAPVGGEAAAYDRGTATLVKGEATVICPEHFGWVADEKSMTVTITPLSADSKGIAVIEKSNGGFKVKELNGGSGNYSFDYLVMCKRKGLEDFEVVRKKPQMIADNSTDILQNIPEGPLKSIRDLVPTKSTN